VASLLNGGGELGTGIRRSGAAVGPKPGKHVRRFEPWLQSMLTLKIQQVRRTNRFAGEGCGAGLPVLDLGLLPERLVDRCRSALADLLDLLVEAAA
jgi:hypothetical protein